MAIRKIKTKTKGTRYAARVHVGDGKYKLLESRATRAAAREDEATWLLSKSSKAHTTGNDFADFFLTGYGEDNKASSLHHAESALRVWRREFGTRTLASIDETEAEEWARENKWAVSAVVTMMNYAVKKKVIPHSAFAGLTKKSQGRKHNQPLTVAQVEKLAAVAGAAHGDTMRAFIIFTAYSGMRVGEVFALQWGDVDFKANRINVRRRLYRGDIDLPKSNKVRQVVLLPEARDALLVLDRKTDWVFPAKRSGQMTQAKLTYYWQKISAGFGSPIQPHELKHFCGHHLYVTLGLPDRVVAVQLGHNDGGKLVRELYGHGDVGALDEIEQATKRRPEADVLPLKRATGTE